MEWEQTQTIRPSGVLEALHLFDEEMEQNLHLFDVEELDKYLAQTGFRGFAYDVYGPAILFHAEKE